MVASKSHRGYITRLKLINEAKKQFYQQGFKKTKMTEVCRAVDEKQGTFTYYFKTKEDLISQIYGELLMQCYSFVGSHALKPYDVLQKNITAVFLYYLSILTDDNTIRFHYEVVDTRTVAAYIGNHVFRIHQKFNREYNLNLTSQEVSDVSAADLGMRRELTLELLQDNNFKLTHADKIDFISKINIFMGRVFTLDEYMVREYIKEAVAFEEEHDYSKIIFLV